jgi:molybdate transport system ATP-binding protein
MASAQSLSVHVVYRSSNGFTLEAAFDARPGFTMILGPSGAGTTPLLNCIAGFIAPDAGRIALGARALFDSEEHIDTPPAARRLGYVFQNLALFPHLTATQNVQYGLVALPGGERRERAAAMLATMRIAHLAGRKPGEISGGERQRVALARSLVTNPDALMLDEPLAALDAATKSKILDDLRAWNAAREIPILYVTHSPDEAFALGERVVVLEAGRILAQGMPQYVLTTPRHETIAQVVGFENVFDATVKSIAVTHGTMLCQLDGGAAEIEVPLGHAQPGDRMRVAIRAGDIIVAAEPPHGLSARNTLHGTIVSIRREGVRVVVLIDAGASFEAHLTPGAIDSLQLEAGKEVWLVIKTYSCNLVEPSVG